MKTKTSASPTKTFSVCIKIGMTVLVNRRRGIPAEIYNIRVIPILLTVQSKIIQTFSLTLASMQKKFGAAVEDVGALLPKRSTSIGRYCCRWEKPVHFLSKLAVKQAYHTKYWMPRTTIEKRKSSWMLVNVVRWLSQPTWPVVVPILNPWRRCSWTWGLFVSLGV